MGRRRFLPPPAPIAGGRHHAFQTKVDRHIAVFLIAVHHIEDQGAQLGALAHHLRRISIGDAGPRGIALGERVCERCYQVGLGGLGGPASLLTCSHCRAAVAHLMVGDVSQQRAEGTDVGRRLEAVVFFGHSRGGASQITFDRSIGLFGFGDQWVVGLSVQRTNTRERRGEHQYG